MLRERCIKHISKLYPFQIRVLYATKILSRIFNRKFPKKIELLERFLAMASTALTVVRTPADMTDDENLIRDIDDRPILRAAKNANVDILITGDKDFLESGVTDPKIITAAEFLEI